MEKFMGCIALETKKEEKALKQFKLKPGWSDDPNYSYNQLNKQNNDMDVLQQLRKASKERQSYFDNKNPEWNLPEWGNALAGEVGELCNVVKKIHRGDFTLEEANEKELLADEAADVVIYLDLLCAKAGISLQNAIVNKFNKSSKERDIPVTIYYY